MLYINKYLMFALLAVFIGFSGGVRAAGERHDLQLAYGAAGAILGLACAAAVYLWQTRRH